VCEWLAPRTVEAAPVLTTGGLRRAKPPERGGLP
jgi:hypothetical protein